jgi:DNA-binding winged helix-turn-helix (wHTH) protein/tetratricopeptide (TPR) repeat protein
VVPGLPAEARHLRPFTVGGWRVEPKACRLARAETTVRLRPQLMDLLVCLARRAGDIVLKEEILAEVWAAQYIAESGLSRCIAELRQALGDDAHVPRFIETIPKRGYRLVADVAWPDELAPDERTPGATVAGGAPDTTDAAAASVVRHGDAAGPARARGDGTGTTRRRSAALASVVVGAGALTAVAMLSMGGWGGRRVSTDRATVLVADVVNTTGDKVFDDTLRLAVGVNIGQAPFVRLLPREAVRGALVRAGRPPDGPVAGAVALDVCRREGADIVLGPSIARLGSTFTVGLEAVACESGEEIWRTLEQASGRDDVLRALERTATSARRMLGETRESLIRHSVPLERATTPSLDALKALSLGDDSRDHGRLDEALAFYKQATDLDPRFALAWARLGIGSANVGRPEEAWPAISRAYALVDRVSPPERFYISAHYQRNVAGDIDAALETYRAWRRLYPGSLVPPTNIANILVMVLGDYPAAVREAEDALRLAPFSSVAGYILNLAYRGAGRADEARALLDKLIASGVHDRLVNGLRLETALMDGDAATVDREMRRAGGQPSAEVAALVFRASDAVAHGRVAEAAPLWRAAFARAAGMGTGLRVAEAQLFAARALAVVGESSAARQALEASLAADRSPWTLVHAAVAAALLGDGPRVRTLLAAADGRPENDPGVLRTWAAAARALAAAQAGSAEEAAARWQSVARFERGALFYLLPLYMRGSIERAGGRSWEAAATFARLEALRAVQPTAPWVALATLERARALRDAGDSRGSLAAYDEFLRHWAGADATALPLVAARREREALSALVR